MASIGVSPTTPRQRFILITCALLAAVALMVIAQLNSVLATMRIDGGVAGSVDDLTVSFVPYAVPNENGIQQVLGTWRTYDTQVVSAQPQLEYAGPLATANAVLRWDSLLLIPAYTVLLITLLIWARSWPPPPPGQPVPRAVSALARSWFLLVVVGITAVADLVENLALSGIIDQAWDAKPLEGENVLVVAGFVKWAGFVLVLAPFAVIGVRALVGVLRPVLRTAWFPVLVLVALAVASLSDQAADVVRRWGVGQTIWTVLGVALLSLAIGTTASRQFQIGRTPITVRAQGQRLTLASLGRAAVALLPLALVAAVILLAARLFEWRGMVMLALVLVACFVLSLPIRHFWDGEQTVEVPAVQTAPAPLRHKIGAVLAAAVPFLVGIPVLRAATADVFYRRVDRWLDRNVLLLSFGILLMVGGSLLVAVAIFRLLRWLAAGGRVRRWGLLGVLVVVTILPSALLTLRSTALTVAQGMGAATIVLVFLAAVTVGASLLYVIGDGALRSRWAREAALPPSVRLLGFDRPPLVGVLGVWLVLAALLDPGGYHDVRAVRRSEVDVETKTVTEVFAAWRDRQPDAAAEGASQPMVVVAAGGGGLRSAYWTALVLDCVLERNPDPATGDPCGAPADEETVAQRRARLFATSGVGGGGLGLVTYDTHADVDGPTTDPLWFDDRLRDDFFAPTLAWGLFRDASALLLRPGSGRDRATALERAIERPWRLEGDALAEPLLTSQTNLSGPLLLLNSYSVDDGCRISTAIIATGASRPINQCGLLDPGFAKATSLDGTTDFLDFLVNCPTDADVRRSTAAVLGARFPFVSPAGRLRACDEPGSPEAFVVQGGYRDASAASTLVELWPEVQPLVDEVNDAGSCLVPYFVQIDADENTVPPIRPDGSANQVITPANALAGVPGGNAEAARVAAQRAFTGPVDDRGTVANLDGVPLESRWSRLAPPAQPGATEQDGWALSTRARQDLRDQVIYNAGTIDQLRHLLDAPADALTCVPGAVP